MLRRGAKGGGPCFALSRSALGHMFDKFAHGSSRRKRRRRKRRRKRLLSVHQIIASAEQGFLVKDETLLYGVCGMTWPCPQTTAGEYPLAQFRLLDVASAIDS